MAQPAWVRAEAELDDALKHPAEGEVGPGLAGNRQLVKSRS